MITKQRKEVPEIRMSNVCEHFLESSRLLREQTLVLTPLEMSFLLLTEDAKLPVTTVDLLLASATFYTLSYSLH